MGFLSRLFGTKGGDDSPSASLTPTVQAAFEAAAHEIGWRSLRWEGTRACFEARGKQRFAGLDSFLAGAATDGRSPTTADVAAYIQKLDALLAADDARREEQQDFTRVKGRLRPRLLTPQTVASAPDFPSGPYVEGQLTRVLALDYPETSTFVNGGLLSAWSMSFEQAWDTALDNLAQAASASEFGLLPDQQDILLCSTSDQIASSRALVLSTVLEHDPKLGMLFSVPSSDVLLAHVIRGSGAIAIAPTMFSFSLQLFQSRPHPLNASVFWLRGATVSRLNLSATMNRGTPEINFVTAGDTEEFMKAVGTPRPGAA